MHVNSFDIIHKTKSRIHQRRSTLIQEERVLDQTNY